MQQHPPQRALAQQPQRKGPGDRRTWVPLYVMGAPGLPGPPAAPLGDFVSAYHTDSVRLHTCELPTASSVHGHRLAQKRGTRPAWNVGAGPPWAVALPSWSWGFPSALPITHTSPLPPKGHDPSTSLLLNLRLTSIGKSLCLRQHRGCFAQRTEQARLANTMSMGT